MVSCCGLGVTKRSKASVEEMAAAGQGVAVLALASVLLSFVIVRVQPATQKLAHTPKLKRRHKWCGGHEHRWQRASVWRW
jgi:hypothetical protein